MRHGSIPRPTGWILIALFVLSLPAVTPRIYASDEIQYFSWLRSLAFDHDADFDNEYRHFFDSGTTDDPLFRETFLSGVNENGRRHSFATIGPAVLWSPFFAAGHVIARLTGAAADGYSQPYVAAVAYGSAVYGFLGVLLTRAFVRRVLGVSGVWPILAVWLGTPLLFYMYVAPGFSHACSAFSVSLFLWIWVRVRRQWHPRGLIALGCAGALVAMMREQDAILLAGPALDFAVFAWRERQAPLARTSLVARVAAGAAAFLLAYSPQLAAYEALNGHPSPTRFVLRKMTWTSPHFLQVLFSPEHGLLAWTPLAALALYGLGRLALGRLPRWSAGDLRWIAGLALLMFLLQVYVSGCVESWTVAGAFGQRRFVSLTPLLALGVAAAAAVSRAGANAADRSAPVGASPPTWLGAGPLFISGLIVLCIWWNLGLMAQFGLHTMDRQRLSLRDNARVTFLELPRLAPSLVWRYVTDRSSFYGLPRH